MSSENIARLVQYGIETGLTPACEKRYTTNLLLDVMQEHDYREPENTFSDLRLEEILNALLDEAVEKRLIGNTVTERDLFDTKLMNCLLPRPAQVQEEFRKKYEISPQTATDWYYQFCQDSNYIRRDRIRKDMKWTVDSPYGTIDITINLSKPEKDPRAIAAAGRTRSSSYPRCQLCAENEGYAGRLDHPARENHRLIPITLHGEQWYLQYSPYVYYNEHCIALNSQHRPMEINRETFIKLLEFLDLFPHYFIGSNADLPIVGGSILSHDHFQGGRYTFAMERASLEETFTVPGYEDMEAGIVKWPLSVIRIRGRDPERLVSLADHILGKWRGYTDESAFIFAETEGEPHNTITPIARKRGSLYELDLTLRNNITTKEYPLGVFHPHQEYHHIKKENIGLIEVMGLAVLPARLKEEMNLLSDCILAGGDVVESVQQNPEIEKHAAWVSEFLPRYSDINADNIDHILQKEIGTVFVHVLEDAGVYKCTSAGRKAFSRFISTL